MIVSRRFLSTHRVYNADLEREGRICPHLLHWSQSSGHRRPGGRAGSVSSTQAVVLGASGDTSVLPQWTRVTQRACAGASAPHHAQTGLHTHRGTYPCLPVPQPRRFCPHIYTGQLAGMCSGAWLTAHPLQVSAAGAWGGWRGRTRCSG